MEWVGYALGLILVIVAVLTMLSSPADEEWPLG